MRASKGTGRSGGTEGHPPTMSAVPYLPGQVTADNFLDKALLFMRTSGRSNGEHPVIKKDRDWPAWCAWTAFMRQIGMRTAAAEREGVLTVPAPFPWDFSVDADNLRDSVWDIERPVDPPALSPERRRELANMLRGILPREMRGASLAPKRPRPRLVSRFDEARGYEPMKIDLSEAK